MVVKSSRLYYNLSVCTLIDWSGKSITETDLDFTFLVWLVSTKFIKNVENVETVETVENVET